MRPRPRENTVSITSRELVYQTLDFADPPRAPRQLWLLPWAQIHHPEELKRIQEDFPSDFGGVGGYHREHAPTHGDATAVGQFTDDWGCTFINVQAGVIGEVKNPLVKDWAQDVGKVHIPREWLTIDIDKVNQACAASDQFIMAGACPRPFEQLQFIRGTAELYVDLMLQPPEMLAFVREMHQYYCELLEVWAKTDVDALMFMDDWGSQQALLIDPVVWADFFKPMYRDYIEIAHGAGKRIFMHSDGYTADMYPHLVELGLDALNSQIFCMGVDRLVPYAGKITFWGEICRQHILPEGTLEDVDRAVEEVYAKLWRKGGCIAQCEFGPGAKPENVRRVFEAWDRVSAKA